MNGTQGWNGWERTRRLMSGPVVAVSSDAVVWADSGTERGDTQGSGMSGWDSTGGPDVI